MPIKDPYTLEEFSNLVVDEEVNPNFAYRDLFNPSQLEYLNLYNNMTDSELAALDVDWVRTRGNTFTEEMENLLNAKRQTLRPPLPNPILPDRITENEKWQEYIAANTAKDPNFVPTQDVDEIASIIDLESLWFDRDKFYRGFADTEKYKEDIDKNSGFPDAWLRKRGADAMDLINWGASNLSPTAFSLSKYEAQQELARAGIPYSEGAPMKERFASAVLPRQKTPRDVESIVEGKGPETDTLGYLLPEADY